MKGVKPPLQLEHLALQITFVIWVGRVSYIPVVANSHSIFHLQPQIITLCHLFYVTETIGHFLHNSNFLTDQGRIM